MGSRRRKKRSGSREPTRRRAPSGGIRLTTPEGDALVFTSAQYQHAAMDEILQILREAGDFGLGEDEHAPEAQPDGSFQIPWYETRPLAPGVRAPIGRRVLAILNLTPTTLDVEAMSQRRLDDCHRRLEQLVGERIRRVRSKAKSVDRVLRERKPDAAPPEPAMLPPELVAQLEEQMLRQWIDDSIPALGGLTPREAAKTPEGRRQVLELIDYIGRMQKLQPRRLGAFSPDYRKVTKILGLE